MASKIETLEGKKQEDVPDVEVKDKEESQQEDEEDNEGSDDGVDEADESKEHSKRGRKDSAKKGNSDSKKAKTDSSPKEQEKVHQSYQSFYNHHMLQLKFCLLKKSRNNQSYAKALKAGCKEQALQILKEEQPRDFSLHYNKISG